jgi:sugar (pentulose or hexulose) kinase
MPDSHFNLANFMRTHLFTALGALKVGMDILLKEERITIDKMLGHGGFFKTKGIGERILAAAIDAPVTVMETAGEGGAWGIAVLANYLMQKGATETLGDYLDKRVFAQQKSVTAEPEPSLMDSFEEFMIRYRAGLSAEQAAVDALI